MNVTVPVFVPHAGCPYACSFCNQRAISGAQLPPTAEEAAEVFRVARESLGKRAQSATLAFFGGSFTGILPEYRHSLLKAAQPFLGGDGFAGIRISTRPDCIDTAVLCELREAGVQAIELGVQSMDDAVLMRNSRGHTAADVVKASDLIRAYGFELGHQMMTGLPGDTPEGALQTAEQIIALQPDTVRIYPTVVLRGTVLETWWKAKEYMPQTLEEAVSLGAELLLRFERAGIQVIRLGLHDDPGLSGEILAGPHHPALRELCHSRLLLASAKEQLSGIELGAVQLLVHPRTVSAMIGQHRCNLAALEALGHPARIVTDESLPYLTVVVHKGKET